MLAEQLGISKPTLRQALRVLELSGLVDVRRGKSGGIFVVTDLVPAVAIFTAVKLEEKAAIDVLRARRVLERAVVHEATRTATAADLAELERTVDLLERHLGERPSVMRADAMFHRALVRGCRNETIQTAMRGVARGLAPIRDAYSGGLACDKQTLDVHRRQLAAMRRATRIRSRTCSTSTSACSRRSSRGRSAAAGRISSAPEPDAAWPDPAQARDERRDGVGLGLERRLVDVAEILSVDLERHRRVAADDDALDVVEHREARLSAARP